MSALSVVITGASSGIGEALAHAFAAKGYDVGLAARRTDILEQTAQHLAQKYGIKTAVCYIDMQDDASIAPAMAHFVAAFKHIDIVIANAGIADIRRTGKDSIDKDKKVFQTNLIGNICVVDEAAKIFLAQGYGHIVGISSFSAFAPIPGSAAYTASKAALTNYLNAVRMELAPKHIDVTVIHPGFINTHIAKDMNKYPFVIAADKAAKLMLKEIERKTANAIVPALPWKMVRYIIEHTPDKLMLALMLKFMGK